MRPRRRRPKRSEGLCWLCDLTAKTPTGYCLAHDLSGKCPSCKRPYEGRSTCDCGADPWHTNLQETR